MFLAICWSKILDIRKVKLDQMRQLPGFSKGRWFVVLDLIAFKSQSSEYSILNLGIIIYKVIWFCTCSW